ncbi:Ig-like domain repeat protein [Actinoplanes oblitus]|uniref:Ig-like domain repeat protein n=1 Tax=Actinoplanes oblitus TaxID=3040509 RepID=A0ABY8WEU6_9ACTN|nr:Ig-like domain repeat protein [Actinoplanes oblitus]WIM96381.1 Ig-like domain repeat protein [Actinoplanes oblitus]
MVNRRIGAATVAVLTGTTALAVGSAAPALAGTSPVIAVESVGDILVDGAHQRVFISDPDGGKVVATDYSGNELGSAPVSDARDLALAPDSSRLYVTSARESAVFALDTSTLAQDAKYSTGDVAPQDVAVAGDRIWFSYLDGAGALGTIDVSTETPTVLLDRYRTGTSAAELATASAKPNRIGLASTDKTAVLDVSGDAATEVAAADGNSGKIVDMAISPDGERIAAAREGDQAITLRDVGDLGVSRYLRYEQFANAVDFAADGSVAGGAHGVLAPNLYVFTRSDELITSLTSPNDGRGVDRAVAWEPNGDRLFAISANGTVFRFNAYSDTKQAPTTVTLAGRPSVVPGEPVTLTGKLASSVPAAAGSTVTITRDGASLGTVEIGAGGSFSVTDTPPAGGTVTYQVSYAGDDSHLPSTASTSVRVERAASTVTLWGPSTVIPGAPVTVTGRLTSQGHSHAGDSLAVSRAGLPLGTVTVDADQNFSFTGTAPDAEGTWAYEFTYAGSDTLLPGSATAPVVVSRTASTLTLAGPSSATRAKPLTITGTLASPLALPAGTTVSITRIDLEHPAGTSLGTAPVAANGSFSVTDTPPAGGTVTYRAAYAGDRTHTPATATKAVAVSRTTPSVTLTNGGKVYDYGRTVSFTAHLGATYQNRTVEIWADPSGADQAKVLVKRGTVNGSGNVTASVRLTRDTTVSAVFTGDARTAPRTVTATVGTRVSLTLKVSRHYKTGKIGGTKYRYFHVTTDARFTTSMTGGATRKVYVSLQSYAKGKWRTMDTGYFDATDALYLNGKNLAGVRLRVRTAYVRGLSGDSLNATTWTPYQYFTFTK